MSFQSRRRLFVVEVSLRRDGMRMSCISYFYTYMRTYITMMHMQYVYINNSQNMNIYMYTYRFIYMFVHTYTLDICRYVYIYIHLHVGVRTHRVYMYTCVHVCMYSGCFFGLCRVSGLDRTSHAMSPDSWISRAGSV